ncbi:hypothetical protein N836_04955 [Leptolyngbya sp. Heron Island J]|uniref:hypothetical protein n=1 Tax=Leptolyngbya sp. Heron Island J TaxID=1385935 RepID=UPI0003B9CEEF|nr:hypothetical protein [Leptolyngbya sp. Heron Island J]ESA36912.1 hypothetical protein N836_04955 [Leptolyngbya sp. Heron Island J]
MADPLAIFNPEAHRLLLAFELFEQTYGTRSSELESQATLAALAIGMGITDPNFDVFIQQLDHYRRQLDGLQQLEASVEATRQVVPTAILQQAKTRLASLEARLILRIRTYLQRVSSKLSAMEFVVLTKAAVALLEDARPELNVSLVERKHLLYVVLRTFGTQLSQPIPVLGEQVPKGVTRFVARLVRYQKIMRTDGVSAVCAQLVSLSPENRLQHLSPDVIRHVFKAHNIIVEPALDSQDSLGDFIKALLFESQLQTPSAAKSELAIAQQIKQAITEFRAKYHAITEITQPQWEDELSVSSVFFTSGSFATASNEFSGLSHNQAEKTSKDETDA